MKISRDEMRADFLAGAKSAKFRSYKHAIGQAAVDAVLIVVAYVAAHSWWSRILLFVGMRFVYGFVIQFRAIRRERRSERKGA